MGIKAGHDGKDTAIIDVKAYVIQKIGSQDGPIPRRVLLSQVLTDTANPFKRRTIHRDLMNVLCDLEATGIMTVGPSGLALSTAN